MKLTVKEILNMSSEDLEKMMTEEQFSRMQNLGIEQTWQLLNAMQDGAKQSGLRDNEEYISINEYLDYLEEMKNS